MKRTIKNNLNYFFLNLYFKYLFISYNEIYLTFSYHCKIIKYKYLFNKIMNINIYLLYFFHILKNENERYSSK